MYPATKLASLAVLTTLAACASYPQPVQRMADAEGAARSAQETGAASNPQAQLHLKLAQEGIAQAKQLVANGDNKRADYTLIRAKSDAELALQETRAQIEQAKAQQVLQQIAQMQGGATTTTTSGSVPTPTVAPSSTTMPTTQETKP